MGNKVELGPTEGRVDSRDRIPDTMSELGKGEETEVQTTNTTGEKTDRLIYFPLNGSLFFH